jgi:biotin transporter BioY
MKNLRFKSFLRFMKVFIISLVIMEILEHSFEYFFGIPDLVQFEWGWLAFIVVYGLKFHVFCCIIPAVWTTYRCRHKKNKCNHEHCD